VLGSDRQNTSYSCLLPGGLLPFIQQVGTGYWLLLLFPDPGRDLSVTVGFAPLMGTSTPSLSGHCSTRFKVDGVLPYLNPGVFQDQIACSVSPTFSPGKRQGNLQGHLWCKQQGYSRPAWRTMSWRVDAVAESYRFGATVALTR